MKSELNYKVALIGDSAVGKTSIITRLCHDHFLDHQEATVGGGFFIKPIKINNQIVNLQIWDTAGQERFRSLVPMYARGAAAIVIIFDVTDMNSLNNIVEKWLNFIDKHIENDCIISIVGNKIDNKSQRVVYEKEKEFLSMSTTILFNYYEVSAKTGKNVNEMFIDIANKLADKSMLDKKHKNQDLSDMIINLENVEESKKKWTCCYW